MHLIPTGTGDHFLTAAYLNLGTVHEVAYYKEKVYERYVPDYMADIVNQITDYEKFIKNVNKFLMNEAHLKHMKLENSLGKSALILAFDDKTTEASLRAYFDNLEYTNNPEFTKALQRLYFDR